MKVQRFENTNNLFFKYKIINNLIKSKINFFKVDHYCPKYFEKILRVCIAVI
jgi:hypothetical protein